MPPSSASKPASDVTGVQSFDFGGDRAVETWLDDRIGELARNRRGIIPLPMGRLSSPQTKRGGGKERDAGIRNGRIPDEVAAQFRR